MSKNKNLSSLVNVRNTLFALTLGLALVFTATATANGGFFDSVREFFGFAPAQTVALRDQVRESNSAPTPDSPDAPFASDQYFDGSTTNALTASKWAATNAGPFTSAFVTGNTAVFATVNGTGSGAAGISIGGMRAEENFTYSSPSGTLLTGGTVATMNVFSGKKLDIGGVAISTAAGVGFNKTGTGTLVITSGAAYTGGFTLTSGTMVAGGVNAMGAGGVLNLNGGTLTVNSSTNRDFSNKYAGGISIGGNVQLGDIANVPAGTGTMTFNNAVGLGAATRTITIGSNATYTFSGVVSGGAGAGLTAAGVAGNTGTLLLTNAETYTGPTSVSGTILQFGGAGSILNSSGVDVGPGGFFDVSNPTTAMTLSSGQFLKGSGTTSTGTIALSSTKGLTTASNSPLQFTAFNGSVPPLTAQAGTLALQSGNPVTVTVSNGGTALSAGDYKLIAKSGTNGAVTGTPTSVTVNGDGVCALCASSLVNTGGELFLHVVASTPTNTATPMATSTFTATPTPAQYTLTVTKTGSGASGSKVTSSPQGIDCGATCSAGFTSGSSVTLTAPSTPGYRFDGWSGASCSGTGSCIVSMSGTQSVSAAFTLLLAVNSTDPADGATNVPLNSTVSVTFNKSIDPSTVTVSSSGACSGSLQLSKDGFSTCEPLSTPQTSGPTLTIPAGVLQPGYTYQLRVTTAVKDVEGVALQTQFTMSSNGFHTVAPTATNTPTPVTYLLSVSSAGTGSGTVSSGDGTINCGTICFHTYDSGTVVTLTAVADSNSVFDGWGGDCAGQAGNQCQLSMIEPRSVLKSFRSKSSDASLSNLTPSVGSLTPAFSPSVLTYGMTVSSSTTGIAFTPECSDSHASVSVGVNVTPCGSSSPQVSLSKGSNPIHITVTAEDGTTQSTYTVTVTREADPPVGHKGFDDASIVAGGSTGMHITLSNPNTGSDGIDLTEISFTDHMPAGLSVPNEDRTGVCTTGSLHVQDNVIYMVGGKVNQTAGEQCDISFNVTADSCGNGGGGGGGCGADRNVIIDIQARESGTTHGAPFEATLTVVEPPETSIDTFPPNPDNHTTATFTFSSSIDPATFECSLDNEAFAACTSPVQRGNLAQGPHTFSVRAISGGVTDPTPASYTWTVDTIPPTVTITSPAEGATTGPNGTVMYTTGDAVTVTCTLDGQPVTCDSSGYAFSQLSGGPHTVTVQGTDVCGNVGTDSRMWNVDATGPVVTIISGPADGSSVSSTSATFTYSTSPVEPDATFECKLVTSGAAGAFASCSSSGQAYSNLLDATQYTFSVRAIDSLGNVGPAESVTWTVDTMAPTVTIDSVSPDPTNAGTTVTWHAGESGSYSVRIGGTGCSSGHAAHSGDYVAGAEPVATIIDPADLSEGTNTVRVCVTDAAGNTGSDSRTFTVDRTPPVVTIDAVSSNPTTSGTTSITFHADKSGSYKVNKTAGENCDSGSEIASGNFVIGQPPVVVITKPSDLLQGSNPIHVCVQDAAGNTGSAATSVLYETCAAPNLGFETGKIPEQCRYLSGEMDATDGLPPGQPMQIRASLDSPTGGTTTSPGGSLGGDQTTATMHWVLEVRVQQIRMNRTMPNVPVVIDNGPRTLGDDVQSFATQAVSIQGQLPPGDPDFDLLRITAGSGFGLPSPGHTTLTRMPGTNNWAVDSFFDITYRIDFVGKPGGILGGHSGSTTGTIRMSAVGGPPPPSSCTATDNGTGDPDLPANCPMDGWPASIITGLPPGVSLMSDLDLSNPSSVSSSAGGTLGGIQHQLGMQGQLVMSGTGDPDFDLLRTIPMPNCAATIDDAPHTPGSSVQSFDTEMVSLQCTLPPGDPDFDLLSIRAGSGFGMPSPGHTTLIRESPTLWNVDSFFDITYRIDFVGKPGGHLGGMSGSTTGTIRMQQGTPAPHSITVLKVDDSTGQPLPAWTMKLYSGSGCAGTPLDTQVTSSDGQVDFLNLGAGSYSVGEVNQTGWTAVSGLCQDTTVTGRPSGGSGTDIRHDEYVKNYGFRVDINGASGNVSATGSEAVDSATPCAGCGPNGEDYFDSEIISMDLTGDSSVFGPVHIRESPSRPSLGRTSQRTSGANFPADSFFDVFVELDMADGSTLHNEQPIHAQAVINGFPGYGSTYTSPTTPSLPLLNAAGQPVGTISQSIFIPLLPNEAFIVFRNHPPAPTATATSTPTPINHSITVVKLNNATGEPLAGWTMKLHQGLDCSGPVLSSRNTNAPGAADFTDLGAGDYSVEEVNQQGWTPVTGLCQNATLTGRPGGGPAMSRPSYGSGGGFTMDMGGEYKLQLQGVPPQELTLQGSGAIVRSTPCAGCLPGGGDYYDTEMTQMDITGSSSVFGPVHIRESPSRPSLGRTSQRTAGVDFPADSFFDVFIEIDVPGLGTLHNELPLHMGTIVDGDPPIGSLYRSGITGIQLLNAANQVNGIIRYGSFMGLPPDETFIVFRNQPPAATATNTATPTPTPINHSITVLKVNDTTGAPIAGWTMNLYSGSGCLGTALSTLVTDSNGIVDFTNLGAGSYSVGEVNQPGWTPVSGLCQDTNLVGRPGGSAGRTDGSGGAGRATRPDSPILELIGGDAQIYPQSTSPFILNGSALFDRSATCAGCGPGGRDYFDTEMIHLDITGSNSVFGPVHIRESPSRPSLGRTTQKTAGTDFPADSFFDVFVEIDLPDGSTLHNEQPVHVQATINEWPAINDSYYGGGNASPLYDASGVARGAMSGLALVPLYPDETFIVFRNQPPAPTPTATATFTPTPINHSITVLKVNDTTGAPLGGWTMKLHSGSGCTGPILSSKNTNSPGSPDVGIADFTDLSAGDYSVEEVNQQGWTPKSGVCQDTTLTGRPSGGSHTATGEYPVAGDDTYASGVGMKLAVSGGQGQCGIGSEGCDLTLGGHATVHRSADCKSTETCGNGIDTIDTQITSLSLDANSSVFGPVHIRESPSRPSLGQIRQQTPNVDFPADSFFDIFVEIDMPDGSALHNEQPFHAQGVIDGIPPINDPHTAGCSQVPLLNAAGQPQGSMSCLVYVPLYPDETFIVFRNQPPAPTPTATATATPTDTPTNCTAPDNGQGTVDLPAPCRYFGGPLSITNGLPSGSSLDSAGSLDTFTNVVRTPGGSLGGEHDSAQATMSLEMSGSGSLGTYRRVIHIPVPDVEFNHGPRQTTPLDSFSSDMSHLQGQLPPGDPDFDLLRITAGSDFGMPSPGHTTLIRESPTLWAVDSFFDITYRIDFIGHPGGPLGGMSGSTTGTIRMRANSGPYPPSPVHAGDNGNGTVDLPAQGPFTGWPVSVINGLPPATTFQADSFFDVFTEITRASGGSLGGERDQFNATWTLDMAGTGSQSGYLRSIPIPVQAIMDSAPRGGSPTQSFATEMFGLQGQLPPGDPDFDLLRITAGSSFGMPSPGHTTLIRESPTLWNVDSFFDITYRIDFIGHPGGHLGGMSGSTTGTIRMQQGVTVTAPTPTSTSTATNTSTATSTATNTSTATATSTATFTPTPAFDYCEQLIAAGQATTCQTGNDATPGDPTVTQIMIPAGAAPSGFTLTVTERNEIGDATGFTACGQMVSIDAGGITLSSPATITIRTSACGSRPPEVLQIFRNGVRVPDCTGANDPCVAGRSAFGDGDKVIICHASHFSDWFTAMPDEIISGAVTYGNPVTGPNPRAVPNVLLSGAGSSAVADTTGASGAYSLMGFGSGSYTITPSKAGGVNGAITSFDAAKIAQYVTGNTTFTASQASAADVSGAGGISSFDAAMIARYVASLGPPNGNTGTWRFNPLNYVHSSVTSDQTDDFAAILMGDVSGNWGDPSSFGRSVGNGPEKVASIAAPRMVTSAGHDIVVPIAIDGTSGKGIISYEFDLRYDPSVIQPKTEAVDLAQTLSGGLFTAINAETPGLLRVVVYGPTPLDGSGVLLNLRFTGVGAQGTTSPLIWERIMLNEGTPRVTAANGEVALLAAQAD